MSNPEIKGPLTILELRAENVKKITAVRIKPNGKVVQVTGKNGQGKSSVLDSIWMALDWAHSPKPEQPIHKGAAEGEIFLDLGEIKATRIFRKRVKDGELHTELRLEAKDGSNIRSPQALLDSLVGSLSFNPLEFLEKDEKAKFDQLKSFVPGVDFDQLDAQNETDYAKRTDENRKAKELLAQAAGLLVPDGNWERIDVTQVVADLEAAEDHNRQIINRRANREKARTDIATARRGIENDQKEIERLNDQIERYKARIAAETDMIESTEKRLADAGELPAEIDTGALRQKITDAQVINANADKAERRATLIAQADKHESAATALTEAMDARKEAATAAIAAAKMPVPGLTLADGKAYLNGIMLKDSNRADQLKLSVAVAMAKNPMIRVIRITDGGNDLDEDSMALLGQMAEENGFQVWIERIKAEGGPPAVIMEDGHAKS